MYVLHQCSLFNVFTLVNGVNAYGLKDEHFVDFSNQPEAKRKRSKAVELSDLETHHKPEIH